MFQDSQCPHLYSFHWEHRIIQVGNNLLLPAWSDKILRALSSQVLKTSKDRNNMTCLGNVSHHLTVLARKVSSHLQPEPLLFRFMLVVPHPVTMNQSEECSCVLTVTSPHWGGGCEVPRSHLCTRLYKPHSPSLFSWGNYSTLFVSVLFH